nr:4402_t:CDS:2 [Entrophospora candida]
MSTDKQTCVTCGHIIAKPIGYTTINFRLCVNKIKDLDQLIESKKYFSHFFESRYDRILSNNFSEAFEKMIENHNRSYDIEYIKLWLLELINNSSSSNNPLSKNQVSRAFTALGLKTLIAREKHRSLVIVRASKNELSEIFQKNGI